MNLKQQTFSAVRWTSIAMIGKALLQFVQIAILARLLMPEEFGLMALIIGIVAFAQVFTDMGISNALIHHQAISNQELSSLYWLNVGAGAVLMLLLILLSEPIAMFYHSPKLQPLLMLISIYFLLISFGQQLRVLAEKELRFASLAKIELSAALLGSITTIIWAILSPTVLALVVGFLLSAFVMTLLCWLFLSKGWRPLLYFNLMEIRRFLWFGGYVMANNLVNTINQQVDIFIGGRVLSSDTLGIYSLPRNLTLQLATIINPIITRVGLPIMAKTQDDKIF